MKAVKHTVIQCFLLFQPMTWSSFGITVRRSIPKAKNRSTPPTTKRGQEERPRPSLKRPVSPRPAKRTHQDTRNVFSQIYRDEQVQDKEGRLPLGRHASQDIEPQPGEGCVHEQWNAADHGFRRVARGWKQLVVKDPLFQPSMLSELPQTTSKR